MANAKMQCKMKKVMLVAGMATALNLGMGTINGGNAMMNEEVENQTKKNIKIFLSQINDKISHGNLNSADLDDLRDMHASLPKPSYISELQTYSLMELIDMCLNITSSHKQLKLKTKYENINQSLQVIKKYEINDFDEDKKKHLRHIIENLTYNLFH